MQRRGFEGTDNLPVAWWQEGGNSSCRKTQKFGAEPSSHFGRNFEAKLTF